MPSSPQPAGAPKKTAPARRKRLSQKAARAVADSARLVKGADHRDTHRWDLIAEDGTVLGYVEPSYGGTGRTGRNGWNHRLAESFMVSGPYKTREEAALQCALAWTRVATAPVRRPVLGRGLHPREDLGRCRLRRLRSGHVFPPDRRLVRGHTAKETVKLVDGLGQGLKDRD